MSNEPKKVVAKANEKSQNRNTEDSLLKMGIKGHVLLVIRKAKALAAKNDFKGTAFEESENSQINGIWYSRIKPEGAYMRLEENSDEFKAIRQIAKDCKDDIIALKYSAGVKKLIDAVVDLQVPAGERVLKMDILKDIKL